MDNAVTIELSKNDMIKFLDHYKIPHEKIDFGMEAPKADAPK